MNFKRQSIRRQYRSPRERFVSVLRGESLEVKGPPSWYRRRELFFPLLMIFVFILIAFVVKIVLEVQNQLAVSPNETPAIERPADGSEGENDEEMSYEEAKRIFGGE